MLSGICPDEFPSVATRDQLQFVEPPHSDKLKSLSDTKVIRQEKRKNDEPFALENQFGYRIPSVRRGFDFCESEHGAGHHPRAGNYHRALNHQPKREALSH